MVDYTGIDGPTKPIGFYLERYPVPDDTDLAAFHETLGAHLDALQDVVRKHQNSGWALHECRLNADLRKPVKAALTPSTTTGGITVEEDSNYDPWAFYRALKRFILLTGDGVAIKTHLGYELYGAALSYAGRNGNVLNEDVAEGHGDRDQADQPDDKDDNDSNDDDWTEADATSDDDSDDAEEHGPGSAPGGAPTPVSGADAADKADDEEDSAASPTSVRVPAVDTESLMRPTPRMAARATRRRSRSTDDTSDDEDDSTPSRSTRQRKVQRTVLQGLREDLLRKVTDTC
eukprot:SAG11_NODE_7634_length_1118_cov_12.180569_1_plen_289_part_00